jgi:hypothetical protein
MRWQRPLGGPREPPGPDTAHHESGWKPATKVTLRVPKPIYGFSNIPLMIFATIAAWGFRAPEV